jgi:hypothetical protein
MRFELDRALAAQGLQSTLAVEAPTAWLFCAIVRAVTGCGSGKTNQAPRQLLDLSTIIQVEPSSTDDSRRQGALPSSDVTHVHSPIEPRPRSTSWVTK